MNYTARLWDYIVLLFGLNLLQQCAVSTNTSTPIKIDPKYHLASEAYEVSWRLFSQGAGSYGALKRRALAAIDTFLELAGTLNEQAARDLRAAILKYYRLKYFHDFTNYVITLDDIIDITDHCLTGPVEKMAQVREQFHTVVSNFQDIRRFDTVDKCLNELPDEVAVAHCILHQAVLFNETMQESLTKIVQIKTRQHAEDINSTLFEVHRCLQDFVPDFYKQLLANVYTGTCGFLKVLNASATDLVNDKWRHQNENDTQFPKKWGTLVNILKERSKLPGQSFPKSIFLTLFAANLTSQDIVRTLYN